MSGYIFPQGGQDATIEIPIRATAGGAATGLAHNSAGVHCSYQRPRAAPVDIALVSLASPTAGHTDGGFVEIDATKKPGLYRLDLPDAALASGENWVNIGIHFNGTQHTELKILLDPHPSVPTGKVVADAGNNASTFKTDLSTTATDAHRESFLTFRNGNNAGLTRKVTAFNGTTKFVSFAVPFPTAPATDDQFLLIIV